MASISTDPQGNRKIQFTPADGGRRAVRLGKVNLRVAEEIKTKIEYLVSAKTAGVAPDLETQLWLNKIGDELAGKLAAAGLVAGKVRLRLGDFLDGYMAKKANLKPATKLIMGHTIRNLKDHFGADKNLAEINEGNADDFKSYLIRQGLASSTLARRLQYARNYFRAALRHKYTSSNPFADVAAKSGTGKERQRYVPVEDVRKLLDSAPPVWRTIIGLARFGGMRCPSEVLSLKWSDVNFAEGRVTVPSPKTEHHDNKAYRVIPMFPELRKVLDDAFELAKTGSVYVVDSEHRKAAVGPGGWMSVNLRTQFLKIIRRAGMKPWPRLFQNMRSSCETDLMKKFPIHVTTAWIGNTPSVAMRHYLQVTDEDFDTATREDMASVMVREAGVSNSVSLATQNAYQHPAATDRTFSQKRTKVPDREGFTLDSAKGCETVQLNRMGVTGFEPVASTV